MNLKRLIIRDALLSTGIAALLIAATAGANAIAHPVSDLPALGDIPKAGTLVKAGDAAFSAGHVQEAMKDYQEANAVCFFYENSDLGVARCAATEGDYATSINYYRKVIYGHQEVGDIDLTTEYILVLSQASEGQEAVSLYNTILDMCKKGGCIKKMEVPPRAFNLNGSDYDPAELQAMTHLMRAMNSGCESDARASSEIQKSMSLTPSSAIVYFYEGVFLDNTNEIGASKAFEKALMLSHEGTVKVATRQALAKMKRPA